LGALLLLLPSQEVPTSPPTVPLASAEAAPEIWRLSSEGSAGSAVPFWQVGDKLWLLTAAHNLPMDQAGEFKIEFQEAHPDPSVDLALIMVRVGDVRYLNLPQIAPPPGRHQPLHAIGWHIGEYLLRTDGYSGVSADGSPVMSCEITAGCSGGAVLDEDGHLIGIIHAVMRGWERTMMGDQFTIPYAYVSFYTPIAPNTDWISGVIAAH
jgi:hypothetical protein